MRKIVTGSQNCPIATHASLKQKSSPIAVSVPVIVVELLLAFIFPPAAVLLHHMEIGKSAVINLFLSLAYIPGIIHAVYIVIFTPSACEKQHIANVISDSRRSNAKTACEMEDR